MASGGQKALSGAAQGAAAGASFGPWGALIGGVAGGVMGLAQGDDPTAPNYVPGAPPRIPGGSSGQYGGMYYDPTTGSTQSLSYGQFNPSQMGNQIQDQRLRNAIMGQGNQNINSDLDFQLQSLQQQLQRLQDQQAGKGQIGKQKTFADIMGNGWQSFVDKDGNPIDPNDRAAISANETLYNEFMRQTGGKYGRDKRGGGLLGGITGAIEHGTLPGESGSYKDKGDAFYRWAQDAFKNAGVAEKAKQWKQMQDVNAGNADQRSQAIQALQNQIDYIGKQKEQAGGALTNNPLMNFLNQRNTDPNGGDYSGKYVDPWTQKLSDEADLYREGSHKNYNQTLNPDGTVKSQSEMGIPDAKALTAEMKANFLANSKATGNGAFGGERMAAMDPYQSHVGDFIAGLNRTAERSNVSNQALAAENAARRGAIGGSAGETSRLANQQALEDARISAAAQGYGMEAADKNNWFNQNFNINQHNSDVARTGAQFSAQYGASQNDALNRILQGGFGNEMDAAKFYEALKQQGFGNNQSEQQRQFGNMMGTQGQSSALGQLTLNNQRYDQNLDRQNFGDRLSLLGFLNGENQQGTQNEFTRVGINNAQAGIGNQQGQWYGNSENAYNAATNAGQNAQNMGAWQQQINSNAGQQAAFGQAAMGLGAAAGTWGTHTQPEVWTPNMMPTSQQVNAIPSQPRNTTVDPWVLNGPTKTGF